MINLEDFKKLELKVGKIKDIKDHPEADKLYLLKVDIGKEIQLVAGLKPYYKKEELINKRIIVVSNLKPVKLKGIESQGMLLAADNLKGKISILTIDQDIEVGSIIR